MTIRRRSRVLVASLLGTGLAGTAASGQVDQADIPWALKLGARVHACERNFPVVSQVVLVPDARTYLQEIARWSIRGQWPILFEDDPHAAGFIRRFAPDVVLRVPSAGKIETDTLEADIVTAIESVWAGDDVPDADSLVERFERLGWTPPGIVVADPDDPAWTAAVALGAGRGLPVVFNDVDLGSVDGELSITELDAFERFLEDAADRTDLDWRKMGDDIDTVTVCKRMPIKCRMEVPKAAQVWHAALDPGTGPYATTDALGRDDRGDRWAYVGTIWGDEARAASMAMSSLFLPRTDIWLVSGYERSGPWAVYDMNEIAGKLPDRGYQVSLNTDGSASGENWSRLVMGGISADVFYLNSHGFRDVFHLFKNARLQSQDLPVLDHPMVVSMVHSFSLQRPADRNSVGGRLLERGVYGFLGSVDEPFLMAFVPPKIQLERISAGVPFLIAGRYWPGEGMMSGVWKIASIGDPLMLAPSDRIPPRRRTAASSEFAPPAATDLRASTRALMETLREEPARTVEAMSDLVLLGQDEVARGVWRFIRMNEDRSTVAKAARVALGPLFRARDWEAFVDAYRLTSLEDRDLEARDMLWHLATPRLPHITDPEILLVLAGEARTPIDAVDLRRLGSHLDRVVGTGASRAAVERRLETVTDEPRRKALKKLIGQ